VQWLMVTWLKECYDATVNMTLVIDKILLITFHKSMVARFYYILKKKKKKVTIYFIG
jgi:hypothetical protein